MKKELSAHRKEENAYGAMLIEEAKRKSEIVYPDGFLESFQNIRDNKFDLNLHDKRENELCYGHFYKDDSIQMYGSNFGDIYNVLIDFEERTVTNIPGSMGLGVLKSFDDLDPKTLEHIKSLKKDFDKYKSFGISI
jgi:hypothetical protein